MSRPSSDAPDASAEKEIAKEGAAGATSVVDGWQAATVNTNTNRIGLIDLPRLPVCNTGQS